MKSVELDATERAILKAVSDAAESVSTSDSNPVWTHAIKSSLVRLGHEKGYSVYASSDSRQPRLDTEGGEWLWDLVWADEPDQNWRHLRGIGLACEIEWEESVDEILDDFLKLTVSVAQHRVMVVWASSADRAASQILACRANCRSLAGLRYLVIALHQAPTDDEVGVAFEVWTS